MATPKTSKDTAVPVSVISAQIDELGALEKKLLHFKPDIARVEILRKVVRAHYDASAAAEGFEARGEKFIAMIGPRANERSINPAKLIKAIGLKLYAAIATVTLKALEGNVSPEIVAGVVTSGYTGSRSVKTFERPL